MNIFTDSGLAGLSLLINKDETILQLIEGTKINVDSCESVSVPNLPQNTFKLRTPEKDDFFDSDNAIALHKYFKNLSPRVACRPDLWVSLGFIDNQEYLLSRWALDSKKPIDAAKRKINDRYLLNGKYGYFRNAISRLWWTAHMTFDETKDAKSAYELTKLSFELQEYQFQFMLRKYGSSADVCRRILRHFLAHKSEYQERANLTHNSYIDFIKLVGKRLNLYSSVYLLDLVEESKLNDFISREADAFFVQK